MRKEDLIVRRGQKILEKVEAKIEKVDQPSRGRSYQPFRQLSHQPYHKASYQSSKLSRGWKTYPSPSKEPLIGEISTRVRTYWVYSFDDEC